MPAITRSATAVPSTTALWLCLALGTAPLPARSQPADAKGQTWAQIDQGTEMRRLRDSLRLGEPLTQDDVTFITQTLLPQLESPANRPQIDRVVRRKLRDMQNVADNPATFEQFTKVTADFMVKLARDERKPPVVRVNAALLVGELNDDSKKRPWPGSLAPLAALVADQAMSPEVRIAAAAGLQRHADAARQAGGPAQAACAETIAPAIATLLAPASGMDLAAADWLTGRGLMILRTLGAAAPASAVASAAGIILDNARPLDLRIRSAAVVALSKSKDLDAAKVIATVDSIARTLLEAENAATEERRPVAGKPVEEPAAAPVRRQSMRRLSWSLATLADAVFSEDTTGGVAGLLPEPAPAKDLARRLRLAAADIDKAPGREAVLAALANLSGAQPPEPQPRPQPPEQPPPAEPEPDNPFK